MSSSDSIDFSRSKQGSEIAITSLSSLTNEEKNAVRRAAKKSENLEPAAKKVIRNSPTKMIDFGARDKTQPLK